MNMHSHYTVYGCVRDRHALTANSSLCTFPEQMFGGLFLWQTRVLLITAPKENGEMLLSANPLAFSLSLSVSLSLALSLSCSLSLSPETRDYWHTSTQKMAFVQN